MFEFDLAKSAANLAKHGIGFVDAQALWKDDERIALDTGSVAEPRFLVVGKIEGKHWTAVITERDLNIRIISVRRSRPSEARAYDSQSDQH
ncbi:MAG TPA: BrnT family toxin [Chakrabartia sp.]|jgi:uncharacterized DUF497 family protein|nr:BrnT family toxin [Chakrabartia sp.]